MGEGQTKDKYFDIPPRRGCGFWLKGRFSTVAITYKMPVSLFANNYTMVTSEHINAHVQPDSFEYVTKEYEVGVCRLYFYLVNWNEKES